MQAKQRMIHIVGTAIDNVLLDVSNKKVNLKKESHRLQIAEKVLDEVLLELRQKNG